MESAEGRKERLRLLRERAAAATDDQPPPAPVEEEENAAGFALKFRNNAVRDQKQIPHETVSWPNHPCKTLYHALPHQIAPAQPPKYEEPTVEDVTKRLEGAAQEDVLKVVAEGKKANWDLKRDLEKSLNKLEKRTQRALLELAQHEQQENAARD